MGAARAAPACVHCVQGRQRSPAHMYPRVGSGVQSRYDRVLILLAVDLLIPRRASTRAYGVVKGSLVRVQVFIAEAITCVDEKFQP